MIRKITSKEEESKRKKRNQIIAGAILVGIMVLSTIGYAFQGLNDFGKNQGYEEVDYNGFNFKKINGFWILNKSGTEMIFSYNPRETEDFNKIISSYNLNQIDKYYQKQLYSFSDTKEAEIEIYTNLRYFIQRMQPACLDKNETSPYTNISIDCDKSLPVKNCDDMFIIITESNYTGITQKRNCVFIAGKKEEKLKITDEFLFKIFGIKS